jgi:NAD(P)-dependent dehydrogenase (short-subunit alcohol dehydrogenase family)
MSTDKPLAGQVALVAGATRGAGRGIARMLGEAGATVYCTGRSVRGHLASGENRPETIEETAEMVTAAGGIGRAVRTDHSKPEEIRQLFTLVEQEAGRIDILVNDIWGGEELMEWRPFWELDPAMGFEMLDKAVRTHILTSQIAAPLMIRHKTGLIVEITDGDHGGYRGALFYDLAKMGPIRLAFAMSLELAPYGVTAVAVTPGFLRSEFVLDRFGVTEANWREAIPGRPNFEASETPCFVGRAVAALAADPQVASKTGKAFGSWTLAREYGFTDIDGRRPDWHGHVRRSMEEILSRGGPADAGEMRRLRAWVQIEMKEDADWSRLVARARAALAASSNRG